MRKISFTAIAIFVLSIAVFAQGKTNYSGTWNLDKERSNLPVQMRVDSMRLTVTQTEKELKVDTSSKRLPPNDASDGRGGRMGGRGGFGLGDGSTSYSLEGKETREEVDGPMGKMPVVHKASSKADGSLELVTIRSFSGPMGEVTMTTKETWKLEADGKTLTIDRENTTPRGNQTSKLIFTRN